MLLDFNFSFWHWYVLPGLWSPTLLVSFMSLQSTTSPPILHRAIYFTQLLLYLFFKCHSSLRLCSRHYLTYLVASTSIDMLMASHLYFQPGFLIWDPHQHIYLPVGISNTTHLKLNISSYPSLNLNLFTMCIPYFINRKQFSPHTQTRTLGVSRASSLFISEPCQSQKQV